MNYETRSISPDEWLPDRCIPPGAPLDPANLKPEHGCESLAEHCEKLAPGSRELLEGLYRDTIDRFGCCGFVAWSERKIVGYNNFFPREVACDMKFHGWGTDQDAEQSTLVHNCISVLQNPTYRRKVIGTSLIKASLSWGKTNGWKRFEVHQVMPDDPENFETMQKSAVSFWRKLGFDTYRTRIDFNIVKVIARWEGVAVETEADAVAFWPDWEEKCLVASMALDLTTWEKK